MTATHDTDRAEPARLAIILSAAPSADKDAADASRDEVASLATGLGLEVVGALHQTREHAHIDTYVGQGKLDELKNLMEHKGADVLIVDDTLTARQRRALNKACEVEIFDRFEIVLRTFERRADTPLAWVEIELARLTYALPLVRDDSALGDREGGGGRGGRGNSNVALNKQQMRQRMAELRQRRDGLLRQRASGADGLGPKKVALVGYTNAGKSTWLERLTGAEGLSENKLFATLRTTTRKIPGVSPAALCVDTVGFMQRLPHDLVASFRATLAGARDADLVVVVLDAADLALGIHLNTIDETLAQLEVTAPMLRVLNKWDAADPRARMHARGLAPDAVCLSANKDDDVERLRALIGQALSEDLPVRWYQVPWAQLGAFDAHRAHVAMLEERHDEDGATVCVQGDEVAHERMQKVFGPRSAP